MPRHRSRSPVEREKKDKKHSKRRHRSDSSDSPAKPEKKERRAEKEKEREPHAMETRSKSDSLTFDSGRRNSEVVASSPTKNPGDFANFPEITDGTVKRLQASGIVSLFPVQSMSFNNVFSGDDLIVRDLTGSGKTLAFSLPLIERLRSQNLFRTGAVQAIILAPTRELALQISRTLLDLRHHDSEYNVITVYGGTSISE